MFWIHFGFLLFPFRFVYLVAHSQSLHKKGELRWLKFGLGRGVQGDFFGLCVIIWNTLNHDLLKL